MKALSIRQPWAWLILHGGKDIENRDWATRFRGRVLIHASKGMTRDEWGDAWGFSVGSGAGPKAVEAGVTLHTIESAEESLVRSRSSIALPNRIRAGSWASTDSCCATLARCRSFRWKGQLGFFDVPDEIAGRPT